MKIATLVRILLGSLALGVASFAWAQDGAGGLGPGRGDGLEQALKELELSAEQEGQVKAIMAESRAAREAILAEHGIELGTGQRPDRELMREAMPELRESRQATEAKIAAVLSEEQLAKFKELRKEAVRKVGQKIKERRKDKES